jgi:hypothetical protein
MVLRILVLARNLILNRDLAALLLINKQYRHFV